MHRCNYCAAVEDLGPVALPLAVAQVHAQQHRGPVLRLRATAARLDVDEGIVRIHRACEHAAEFEILHRRAQLGDVGLDRAQRCIVLLAARKLEQLAAVREPAVQRAKRPHDAVEQLLLLAELLRSLGFVPNLRIFELAHDRREALRFHIDVKDTSAVGPRDR